MSAHKSKNFRYRIIDECLQNRKKQWTLENLIQEVSQRLADEFDIQKVSKRSIQYDIALMRQKPPIGYNAPIICVDGIYSYSDMRFSIQNERLSKPDIDNLTEVINTLKQYKSYTHLGDITKIIEKIETIIAINPSAQTKNISFETSEKITKGIVWLKQIFDAVEQKRTIELTIRGANESIRHIVIHPYFIKEYQSEWFLFGLDDETKKQTVVSIQKIAAISPQIITFIEQADSNPQEYFDAIVGISPGETIKPIKITLKISQEIKEKFLQSPLHHTQVITDISTDGALLDITVIPNKDLREIIMKHCTHIKVEAPEKLRKSIIQELKEAHESYYKLSLF
ncbi:MAG: WYL domain-containing protein [Bacteroidales bacterium]|nr:WYL domain-containing protein [Bacteroidales bacterium]